MGPDLMCQHAQSLKDALVSKFLQQEADRAHKKQMPQIFPVQPSDILLKTSKRRSSPSKA